MAVILRIMKFVIQMFGSVIAGSILAGCAPNPPEQQFVDDAMRAVGGRARVEAVKTIVIEGTGVNYNLGQDMKPEAATQQFAITGYMRKIDVANRRQRIEQTRTPKFAYFQGPQPQTQIQVLDGDIAFNVNPAGAAVADRGASGARSPHRVVSPSHHRAALGDQSRHHGLQRADGRHDVRQADFTSGDRAGR